MPYCESYSQYEGQRGAAVTLRCEATACHYVKAVALSQQFHRLTDTGRGDTFAREIMVSRELSRFFRGGSTQWNHGAFWQ